MLARLRSTGVRDAGDVSLPRYQRPSKLASVERGACGRLSDPMRALAATLLLIVGAVFFGYQVLKIASLEHAGIRAEGRIVRSKQETHYSSLSGDVAGYIDNTNYHAVVKFRTKDNRVIEFEDFTGDQSPIFQRPGTTVTVLYDASDPVGSAIIDRGPFWNWVRLVLSPSIYFR
jgi:Protein of unknown function (DUF3592)